MEITINRFSEIENSTLGHLKIMAISHPPIFTIERAWHNNQQGISCIPAGTYDLVPHNWESLPGFNPKMHQKNCYELLNVPGHTGILIHIANTILDVEGCIGPGQRLGRLKNLPAVLGSGQAMNEIISILGHAHHRITVVNP